MFLTLARPTRVKCLALSVAPAVYATRPPYPPRRSLSFLLSHCSLCSSPFASLSLLSLRRFSSAALESVPDVQSRIRNIGISAHIDSGKTTLTERVLYYTGRIHSIHEVKGKDNVGATMDHMELEREKGITITSAATSAPWKQYEINIIDTPGHVDFTIEVERSLRVLDGAVMLLCGVAGVQSQSLTVDRQMKRYSVPRLAFINKLDRAGANPWKGVDNIRQILHHNAAAVQIPIGLEAAHEGVVDIVSMQAMYFDGDKGETVRVEAVPAALQSQAAEKRKELIAALAEVDEELGELFLSEQEPTVEQLKAAIRRQTIALRFVPVFMGSAFKNKGVQPLLDGVGDYLPSPPEKQNWALDVSRDEEKVALLSDVRLPFVGLAFKLEERPFGQLTYTRVYQGQLKKGEYVYDVRQRKKVKVQRIVKMHANDMSDVSSGSAGEIIALFGVDCHSGTTFTQGELRYAMTSMHVPEPVISLSLQPKVMGHGAAFSKALNRFQKEDPTFRVHVSKESQETIISGMGELHLEIYVERMKREYKVETVTGMPKVNYRETCTARAAFSYTHKKQSGGAGQFGKVVGYLEPIEEEGGVGDGRGHVAQAGDKPSFQFENRMVGNVVPPEFFPAIERGFREAVEKGLAGYPVVGVRVVVEDGASHPVDSNEIAFRLAAQYAFREGFRAARPIVLEPIMAVDVEVPSAFQGSVVASLNRRKGMIQDVQAGGGAGDSTVVKADVPLSKMFGYSTDLRSSTEGKGEFSMEYKYHAPTSRDDQEQIIQQYEKERLQKMQDK